MLSHRQEAKFGKEAHDKKLLRLNRELNALWKAHYSRAPIKLDKPIFWGYRKLFVPHPSLGGPLERRYQIVMEVLPHIQEIIRCKNIDFLYKDRKDNKIKKMSHSPRSISPHILAKLSPSVMRYFSPSWQRHYGTTLLRHTFKMTDWLDSKIEKVYLTHVWPANPEIETRIAEIEGFIRQGHRCHLDKLLGYSYKDDWSIEAKLAKYTRADESFKEQLMLDMDKYYLKGF